MSGPEHNPADDEQPTREAWEAWERANGWGWLGWLAQAIDEDLQRQAYERQAYADYQPPCLHENTAQSGYGRVCADCGLEL